MVALLWLGACNTNAVDADPKVPQESVDPTDRERLKSPQDFSDLVEREKLESAQKFYDRLLQNKGKVIYRVIEETAPSDIVHYCFTQKERDALVAFFQTAEGMYHQEIISGESEANFSVLGAVQELKLDSKMIKAICKEYSENSYLSPLEKAFFTQKSEE